MPALSLQEMPPCGLGTVSTPGAHPPRDFRVEFMEIWLTDNNAEIPLADDSLKAPLVETLKIHKDDFWPVMRNYAARSKDGQAPDLEAIGNSMREHEDLHFLTIDEIVGKWWSLTGNYYVPNIQSLECFTPASGVLHRFYDVVINPNAMETKMAAVMEMRPGKLYRSDPTALPRTCSRGNPFRHQPFPLALFIEPTPGAPTQVRPVRGTYGLSKTVVNNKLFVRPKRTIDTTTAHATSAGEVLLHVGLSSVIALPLSCQSDYADDKNGVMMTVKEKKTGRRSSRSQDRSADSDGVDTNRNIKLKVRLPPNSGVTEVVIPDLDCDVYSFSDFRIFPVRSLAPPPAISMHLDYGALWDGSCAPVTKTSMPYEEVCKLLGNFPQGAFKFFFMESTGVVYADDYVRLTTWFKGVGGFGEDYKNVMALYNSLKADGLTLSLKSGSNGSELVRRTNTCIRGSYLLRFSRSHPASLTLEVLMDATLSPTTDPLPPAAISSYQVAVHFEAAAASTWGGGTMEPTVRFSLEQTEPVGASIAKDLVPYIEQAVGEDLQMEPFQPQQLVRKASHNLDYRPSKIPAFNPVFPPFKGGLYSLPPPIPPAPISLAAGLLGDSPPALPFHHLRTAPKMAEHKHHQPQQQDLQQQQRPPTPAQQHQQLPELPPPTPSQPSVQQMGLRQPPQGAEAAKEGELQQESQLQVHTSGQHQQSLPQEEEKDKERQFSRPPPMATSQPLPVPPSDSLPVTTRLPPAAAAAFAAPPTAPLPMAAHGSILAPYNEVGSTLDHLCPPMDLDHHLDDDPSPYHSGGLLEHFALAMEDDSAANFFLE